MTKNKAVWILAGPTASGKSALGVALAQHFDGIVINADSMQVYREIPIISAQPSPGEQRLAPHRLYGFHSLTETYSAMDWAQAAIAEIDAAFALGKQPILVGGSGMYLKALTAGFSPMPDVPPSLRQAIGDHYDAVGAEMFHVELSLVDPVAAQRLHPTDRQRTIRAREIYEVSNRPLSFWQQQPVQNLAPHLNFKTFILMPQRAWLHERINHRFFCMVAGGALDEAAAVNIIDPGPMLTGTRAVGLQSLRDHLCGRMTLDAAIAQGQTLSRQYAKRQYTWFNNQALPRSVAFAAHDDTALAAAVAHFT